MRVVTMISGGVSGVALVVAGLWALQEARDMVLEWGAARQEVAAWGVRSAGIAAVPSGRFETLASDIWRAGQLPDAAWRRSAVMLEAAARLYPADPRYPRLRVLALAHIGDVDGTIAALNDYRSLPAGSGDKVAQ